MIVDFMLLVNLTVCDPNVSATSNEPKALDWLGELGIVDRPTYLLDCVAPAADGPCLLACVLAGVHVAERGSAGSRCARDGLVFPLVVQVGSEA
jgi:hypothetical protein